MKSKRINFRDRSGFQELNQLKNLQLESLYSREAETRIRAWKRHQDEIAQQRCNWPPPINGTQYTKREEAIYNVNTNNYDDNSWFHRQIYQNDLIKATQKYRRLCDFVETFPEKKTKLETEITQLSEKLQRSHSNYTCIKPMYPVDPSIHYLLYNGISQELNYLHKRNFYEPDEKYCEPLCTSWDITWNYM